MHTSFGAFESHGPAQFFRFASREAGHDHSHAQELLLKKRNAQRARQHRLERWMQALGYLAALPAAQKRIQQFSNDRAGPDDGHLYHDVVEALRPKAWKAGHLRTALHLKQADGV